jgi:DNA-binding response OmpR family regulator
MRILVVEDEDKVSRFVVKGLTAERFAVDVARASNRAFTFLRQLSL